MSSGIKPLSSFFELWLRDVGADLMGEGAQEIWRDHMQHPAAGVQPEGLSQRFERRHETHPGIDAPVKFTLDGAVCDSCQTSPEKKLRQGRAVDAYPVAAAWHSFVWTCTCREVRARFAEDHRLHLVLNKEPRLEKSYSMLELYTHLFCGVKAVQDPQDQWRNFANALHGSLHEKLQESSQCRVCMECRLWQDSRETHADWGFNGTRLLWEAVVATLHQYGIAWSAWQPDPMVISAGTAELNLPPKLTIQDIPLDQVRERPEGIFEWG